MTRPRAHTLLSLAALLAAHPARADRQELFTLLGYEAGVTRYLLPADGSGSATTYAGALDVSVYYGLSNTLHVGGRLRATSSSDVCFSDTSLVRPDGVHSAGEVFGDHRALGLGALALYRFDTGYSLAPVVELEAGVTVHQYRSIAHLPAGAGYSIALSDVSETVFHGAGALLLEYRFRNRWIFSTGVGVRAEPGGLNRWSVFLPLRFGRTWW